MVEELPSKWTGRHWLSSTSQARIRCFVSRLTLRMPQVLASLRTVVKVKGFMLMHRFSLNRLPPWSLHTAFTRSSSLEFRKDCVGRSQPSLRMYAIHWFWSKPLGVSGRMWRLMKVLKPLFQLVGWHGRRFLARASWHSQRHSKASGMRP
ncbi:hypothetical protein CRUP_003326 [Coryphaenoides rupestris]|nr:hypothetical protein CRUP_003326 [Coryphaenoides rupestris]